MTAQANIAQANSPRGHDALRVAVVGAGLAGLAAARTFIRLGMTVELYDTSPDVGGVWSSTRSYPGLAAQNSSGSFAFSDIPLRSAFDAPLGTEVHQYLTEFAHDHGIGAIARLRTRVHDAEPTPAGWRFQTTGPDGTQKHHVDWLIVANGLCSKPHIPEFPGVEQFKAVGGVVVTPSQIGDGKGLEDRDIIVVGWGKSAADIAVASVGRARSVTAVVRRVGWKLPTRVSGISWERIMLSRVGEHLLWGPYRTVGGRVLRRLTGLARPAVLWMLASRVGHTQRLVERGLQAETPISQLDHIMTDGLLDAVDGGRVVLRRGARVEQLSGEGGSPTAHLSDGAVLRADVLVAATGFDVDLSLFTDATRARLLDTDGSLTLARYTVPRHGPNLAFLGWTPSFRTLVNAEVQALWAADYMAGRLALRDTMWRSAARFRFDREAAARRDEELLPPSASFITLDQWLADLHIRIPWRKRRHEIFGPMRSSAYAGLLQRYINARVLRANRGRRP